MFKFIMCTLLLCLFDVAIMGGSFMLFKQKIAMENMYFVMGTVFIALLPVNAAAYDLFHTNYKDTQ